MGFTEGFNSTFNTVDQALGRRSALELEQQRMAKDDVRYADKLGREDAATKREVDWHTEAATLEKDRHTEAAGLAAAEVKYKAGRDIATDALKNKELGIQAATSQAAIAAHNAQLETNKFSLEREKLKATQSDAAASLKQYFVHNQETGTVDVHLPNDPAGLAKFSDTFRAAYQVDVADMARNIPGYAADLNLAKDGVINPGKYANNPAPMLDMLNRIAAPEIKINKGRAYGGTDLRLKDGIIDDVKATTMSMHPADKYHPQPYLTIGVVNTIKLPDGTRVDDKEAPITQYRSDDPADSNVQTIGFDRLAKYIDKNENILNIVRDNPVLQRQLASIVDPVEKEKLEQVKKRYTDTNGNSTEETIATMGQNSGKIKMLNTETAQSLESQRDVALAQATTKDQVKAINDQYAKLRTTSADESKSESSKGNATETGNNAAIDSDNARTDQMRVDPAYLKQKTAAMFNHTDPITGKPLKNESKAQVSREDIKARYPGFRLGA